MSMWDSDAIWMSPDLGDELGFSVSGAGDVDGDGLADVVVGAPNRVVGRGVGVAYVLLGAEIYSGLSESIEGLALTPPIDGGAAGWSVAGVEDVDGDGLSDVVVGDPFLYMGAGMPGGAWLVPGEAMAGASSVPMGDLDYLFYGMGDYGYVGASVAGADVDADGRGDLLIGGPFAARGGQAWLLRSRY